MQWLSLQKEHNTVREQDHPEKKGYLLPGVPGLCQNVPGTAGAAAGAAAATAAILTMVVKIRAVAAAAPAAVAAAAPAAAPAVPGTFWQNPGTPGNRYPFCPG